MEGSQTGVKVTFVSGRDKKKPWNRDVFEIQIFIE